jgi:hypothetical protein
MKYIYQHLGMGDHLICNGLIRKIIKSSEQYTIFCKPRNIYNVSFMYKDLKNINILGYDDNDVRYFLNSQLNDKKISSDNIILIGHIDWQYPEKSFEYNFYMQHQIPLEEKWNSFLCSRDLSRENKILKFNNIKKDYILIHEDNRFVIDKNRLPKDIRIISINPTYTSNIFDYCSLIENAKEFHCIESCFCFMNDFMNLNKNCVAHRYARSLSNIEIPQYKNVKEILV